MSSAVDRLFPRLPRIAPGLALVAAVAVPAALLGQAVPLLGGAVAAIVLGLLVRLRFAPGDAFDAGIAWSSRRLLQASVVLLGFGLDLGDVARTGLASLPVTLVTLTTSFIAAWMLGRRLRVPGRLAVLIGVGTAICGGSAIAAVVPILRPRADETAFAISTIFLFNLVAVLLFPALGHLLGLSDAGFGLWAGTAINDTSSVVAAGYAFSAAAGDQAVIVKLTRATLIIPICLALAAIQLRRGAGRTGGLRRIVPWFILGFVAASALRSTGLLPAAIAPLLHSAAGFAMVLALAAVGLSADLRQIRATGPRPVLLGLGVWVAVATSGLLVQVLTGAT
ncbi:MAG TPA: putative sulfate exporter family transporter [Lysobacter sp.]